METKSQEWIEQMEIKIREAFELFDKDKADAIIQVLKNHVIFSTYVSGH